MIKFITKKISLVFLSLMLSIVLLPIIGNFDDAKASTTSDYNTDYCYEYVSNKIYEVDLITDDGQFEKIESYDDFASAKALMQTNDEYVVRCKYGLSPSRIVAMNSGLVYSYPRGSSSIMNIWGNWQDHDGYTNSYVDRFYEMTYIDTPYMSSNTGYIGLGYAEVIMNGFHGYIDLEYSDLIPSKFIDNQLPIYIGGPYGTNTIEAKDVIAVPNYYVVNKNGNYYDLEFHYHTATQGSGKYMNEFKKVIDNAFNYSFMNNGTHYFSDNGYDFYTNYKKTKKVGTCYGYYQFLPIRTKTSISASIFDSFLRAQRSDYASSKLNNNGSLFVNYGDVYGCNAALIYSLACNESAWGTSGYAIERNNLYGWSAYDDSPDDASYFSSVDNSIKEMMGINLRKYADYTDGRYNGTYFGNKGSGFNLKYASDPYWGMTIASIYYSLDKYANNKNGNLTDYNKWVLGVVTTTGANIYYDEACSRKICGANYRERQVANIVVLLEDEGECYKIQFSNPISNGVAITNNDNEIGYSWSNSVAYIKKNDIQVLNNATVAKKEVPQDNLPHEAITSVSGVSLKQNTLKISGIGAITNMNFTNENNITHTIKLTNFENSEDVINIDCTNTDTNGFSMNDGFDYKYAGFSANIDLSTLNLGTYTMSLITTNGSETFTSVLRTTDLDYRNLASCDSNLAYRFSANQDYAYRIEIDVQKTNIDFSSINKPSKRASMKQFDSLAISEDGIVEFSGYSMIYYLNYEQSSDNRFSLILVDYSTGTTKEIALSNIQISDVIKAQINSVYNIPYIGFTGTIDLNELAYGDYTILLKINTKDGSTTYKDIIEFNAEDRVLPDATIGNRSYAFHKGLTRNRLMIEIKEVSE